MAFNKLVVTNERCKYIDTKITEINIDNIKNNKFLYLKITKSLYLIIVFVQLNIVVAPVFYNIIIFIISYLQQFTSKQNFFTI